MTSRPMQDPAQATMDALEPAEQSPRRVREEQLRAAGVRPATRSPVRADRVTARTRPRAVSFLLRWFA
jgi:hypothetical protein